jgi:hypothetical protein
MAMKQYIIEFIGTLCLFAFTYELLIAGVAFGGR